MFFNAVFFLINEGMIRDLIRKIQNLRKDSNFRVDDRIIIRILADDKIYKAIELNKKYLLSEVLAVELKTQDCSGDFTINFSLNNSNVQLGISKNNG